MTTPAKITISHLRAGKGDDPCDDAVVFFRLRFGSGATFEQALDAMCDINLPNGYRQFVVAAPRWAGAFTVLGQAWVEDILHKVANLYREHGHPLEEDIDVEDHFYSTYQWNRLRHYMGSDQAIHFMVWNASHYVRSPNEELRAIFVAAMRDVTQIAWDYYMACYAAKKGSTDE